MYLNYIPNDAYSKMETFYYCMARPSTPWKLSCEHEHPRDKTFSDLIEASLERNQSLTNVVFLSVGLVVFILIGMLVMFACRALVSKSSVYFFLMFVQILTVGWFTWGVYKCSLSIDEGQ